MFEVQCTNHNVNFISHKNINPTSHLNQDRASEQERAAYDGKQIFHFY